MSSTLFCCPYLCEIRFPKILQGSLVQLSFFNFTELPLLLFLYSVKMRVVCPLRFPGCIFWPHFYLDFLFPSLLSLPCSVLIPFPAASSQCGTLSWKGAMVSYFPEYRVWTSPASIDLHTVRSLHLLVIGVGKTLNTF